MIIRRIDIGAFGKLKNKTFSPQAGLTVMVGANESGKSTLARFIRFMLYGFGASRKNDVRENDKRRYTPWDEETISGELTLDDDNGVRYTVKRAQGKRQTVSVTDASGVPVFASLEAGEALLGIGAEAFEKTALVSAGDMLFGNSAALESAIRNMVVSADADVDTDKALENLEKYRFSLLSKAARAGSLPEAQKTLAALTERRASLAARHKELLSAESQLAAVRENLAEKETLLDGVRAEMDNLEAKNAADAMLALQEAAQAYEKAKNEYETQLLTMTVNDFLPDKAYLTSLNEAILSQEKAKRDFADARREFDEAESALREKYRDTAQMRFNKALADTGRTAAEVASSLETLQNAVRGHRERAKRWLWLFFLIFPLFLWYTHRKKAAELQKELDKLPAAFGAESVEELRTLLDASDATAEAANAAKARCASANQALAAATEAQGDAAVTLCGRLEQSGFAVSYTDTSDLCEKARTHVRRLDEALRQATVLENAMKVAEARYETLKSAAGDVNALAEKAARYDAAKPFREAAVIRKEIQFYTLSIDGLHKQEREYETRTAVITANMEKPDELAAEIERLTEEVERAQKTVDALDMAADALRKAHGDMQNDVSPLLTKEASALFRELTDGRYEGLYVASDLSLSFLESGSAAYRDVAYLSTGAMDAAYLCARLSLIRYLYKQKPVLIFDDAFSHFDDARLARMCDMLKRLAKDYQILLLTCHEREKTLLGNDAAVLSLDE